MRIAIGCGLVALLCISISDSASVSSAQQSKCVHRIIIMIFVCPPKFHFRIVFVISLNILAKMSLSRVIRVYKDRFTQLVLILIFVSGKVLCYYGSWAKYRRGNGNFNIANIKSNLCDIVVYAFLELDNDLNLRVNDALSECG